MAFWTTTVLRIFDSDGVTKWLLRALVTLILAVAWHYFLAKKKPVSQGNQLEETWEPSERRQKWLESLETQQQQQRQDEDTEKDTLTEDGTWVKVSKDYSKEKDAVKESEEDVKKEKKKPGAAPRRSRPLRQRPTPPSLERPPMTATTNDHPGMGPFCRWYDIEASLYRIHVVGRTDDTPVVCPFVPKSERGNVKVELEVTNRTAGPMDVFWVDYKGKEVYKGSANPGGIWYQTTWIGHPWVCRAKNGKLLLNYIPYKIAPTTDAVSTVSHNDPNVGQYRFEISHTRTEDHDACRIVDPIFPTDISTPTQAITWSLQHMSRFWPHVVNDKLLLKYLNNILLHPAETKYRQIRIANKTFFNEVWNTPCRGVLLAAGFVERGAYAELGSAQELPSSTIAELSAIVLRLQHWQAQQEGASSEQPEGAMDGYGRAGFGRAGQMNL